MIDLAVIASTPHLPDLSATGTIDMALTHLVLADSQQAGYFAARAATGVRVLLDNSAYELETETGQGMDAAPVLHAADRIDATVVICQDVLYDGPATVTATRRFLTQAADLADPGRFTYMAVPQGQTRAEWLDCYQRLIELPGVGMIGLSKLSVPRCFAAPVAEARLDCLATLTARPTPPPPLHLLGGDRSLIWELRQHHQRGNDTWISGNDSSFAYWYAAHNIRVDPDTGRAERNAPDRPELTTSKLTGPQLTTAQHTISHLRAAAELPPPHAPAAAVTEATTC